MKVKLKQSVILYHNESISILEYYYKRLTSSIIVLKVFSDSADNPSVLRYALNTSILLDSFIRLKVY